jgi:hypothetical protein
MAKSKRQHVIDRLNSLELLTDIGQSFSYMVYVVNPLHMYQPIQIVVTGIEAEYLTKMVLGCCMTWEHNSSDTEHSQSEAELTGELIDCLIGMCKVLNKHSRVTISAAPHCELGQQSGIVIKDIYPDDNKVYPQPTVILYDNGMAVASGYAGHLITGNQDDG